MWIKITPVLRMTKSQKNDEKNPENETHEEIQIVSLDIDILTPLPHTPVLSTLSSEFYTPDVSVGCNDGPDPDRENLEGRNFELNSTQRDHSTEADTLDPFKSTSLERDLFMSFVRGIDIDIDANKSGENNFETENNFCDQNDIIINTLMSSRSSVTPIDLNTEFEVNNDYSNSPYNKHPCFFGYFFPNFW